jgi:hypothetical protein
MAKQQQFETTSRNVAQIETFIARLARAAELLDEDIKGEEERASVQDPRDAGYPIRARTLTTRRDNLRATIASLEALVNPAAKRKRGS